MKPDHFDAIIIGSGFGGSVVACRLAEAGMRVCLLERGRAFPPGSFPRTQYGMGQNVWDPSRGLYGMFNAWTFQGIEALVSSGLGGGSLIYANVLLRKPPEWFAEDHESARRPWPVSYADLESHYDRVEQRMNVQPFPFAHYPETKKTAALEEAARHLGLKWELPPLAVTFANDGDDPAPGEPIREARPNLHRRTRTTCRLCGECDVGCNYGSKNTLDYTYLTDAYHAGADIRPLCEVRQFEPRAEGGYRVEYVRHDPDGPHWKATGRMPDIVTADRLVISAGTLGSTFLLLKCRHAFPQLSPRLGERFCGNGDLVTFATKCGVGRGRGRRTRDLDPTYGPVITSMIRVPDRLDGQGNGRGFFIQDAGFPSFVTWLMEEANVKGAARRLVRAAVRRVRARLGRDPRADISAELADILGECTLSRGSLPLLGMGRDVPDGRFSLTRDACGEPYLACDWTIESSRSYFDPLHRTMADVAAAWGGTFVPNPTYRISRVITVHPLGGCPMGLTADDGVVDAYGKVFGYDGLYVADGAVMPGPVGANPALTIAALADRTADRILATV